jgi:apolipoprotein N-acyltransferase
MSRKLALGLALALCAASPFAASAQAGLSDSALAPLRDQLLPLETAQFIYNGRQYCWYEDGWRGPGWYWCGQAYHEGVGWGGAYGWNGWRTVHSGGYRHGAHHRAGADDQGGAH